jgi:hypothetical protein
VNRKQGGNRYTLLIYLASLFLSFDLVADSTTTPKKNSRIAQHEITEGWIEKKIAPPTQWVESIFAPFTLWMETEIQSEIHTQSPPSSTEIPSHNLITVQHAINSVLKNQPGKILRSQFKTGPPPYYRIKILSEKGAVSNFYINAFTGNQFIPSHLSEKIEEIEP